jgi:hypothetical protein
MSTSKCAGLRSGIVTCFLLLALIPACTPSVPNFDQNIRSVRDGGFLSGEPCGPPCFVGIVPGVTRETEAIRIVKAERLCGNYETFDNEPSGYRGFICTPSGVYVSFRPGTDIVELVGYYLSPSITLGDVIARYGEPDAVSVGAIGIPEIPKTMMSIYYDSLKSQLFLCDQEGVTFRAEPATGICRIGYSDVASYERQKNQLRELLASWNGYGEYHQYVFH